MLIKNMFEKIFVLLVFFSLILSAFPAMAGDYGLSQTASKLGYRASPPTDATKLLSNINTVISVGLSTMAIIFFLVALYAGLRWMTARGNDELAEKGRDALINATLGLIIIIGAYGLTNLVINALVMRGGEESEIINPPVESSVDGDAPSFNCGDYSKDDCPSVYCRVESVCVSPVEPSALTGIIGALNCSLYEDRCVDINTGQ